jgi:3-oxoadipate enol-lactonase
MPYLERKDSRIFYETWGDSGEWITLVNGFSRTLDDFRPFARFLAGRGFRVASLDNRGAGRTICESFLMADSVRDVAALWDHLSIKSSGLLGISYGGALSMAITIANPTRVSRLMLVSSSADSKSIHPAESTDPESMKRYFSKKFLVGHEILVGALIKEMTKAFSDPQKMQSTRAQRKAMEGYNYDSELAQINIPVMILQGEEDLIVEPVCAMNLAEKIPGAQLELVPGVGHLFLVEAPKKLYEMAADFFSRGPIQ